MVGLVAQFQRRMLQLDEINQQEKSSDKSHRHSHRVYTREVYVE